MDFEKLRCCLPAWCLAGLEAGGGLTCLWATSTSSVFASLLVAENVLSGKAKATTECFYFALLVGTICPRSLCSSTFGVSSQHLGVLIVHMLSIVRIYL